VIEDDVLCARGAVDAKASVTAMLLAAARFHSEHPRFAGRLSLLFTCCEETKDTTFPRALQQLEAPPDVAIIGEPTSMRPCVGQHGLIVARGLWRGDAIHAAWAGAAGEGARHCIFEAAHDLLRLQQLRFDRAHPVLGETSCTVTMLHAGEVRNMTPQGCEALFDVRWTPAYTSAEILAAVQGAVQAGEVEILSDRLQPVATPIDSTLLGAVLRLEPAVDPFVSPTMSDWTWLPGVDAIKWGPGASTQSHTVNESLPLGEFHAAIPRYLQVLKEVLA
jgi:acetylornithine deacetylase